MKSFQKLLSVGFIQNVTFSQFYNNNKKKSTQQNAREQMEKR